MKEAEKTLDPQLWHACAGGMVQMPPLNSTVFYFPQGHAEHAQATVDFAASLRIPPLILCRVAAVKFLADPDTDEVYAKIKLIPLRNSDLDYADDDGGGIGDGNTDGPENSDKPASFAKTLTQSDANNGGGFSVPRYCAETIFPRLDYSAEPPVQTVIAKDVHGEIWKFRHIYRGTPRRHLLTTGWSTFVNQKKLVAGDSVVFLRAQNGDLCVGIRRAKRGIGGGSEVLSGWSSGAGNCMGAYGALSVFLREEKQVLRNNSNSNSNGGRGRVRPESVMEAVSLAASAQAFEIVYYPRASTPEFCVKAGSVRAAMRIQWCCGMRFKMAFETEDSSRISWFMGTVASVQVLDPIRWPNSPWRLLQVSWDEPDLLQNVKRVSPWLVELVSNRPVIHVTTPFSPPRKKLRLPHHADFPGLDGHFTFAGGGNPSSPLCCVSDNAPAGIQGARHAQFGLTLSDFHLNNKLHLGLHPAISHPNFMMTHHHLHDNKNDSLSCLLTMGNSYNKSLEKSDNIVKTQRHQFVLFGQPILTEEQQNCPTNDHDNKDKAKCLFGVGDSDLDTDTGHCKVFMESEDVGRTLDLSRLDSYEELYRRLANMFGLDTSHMFTHVLYRDATGALKQTGEEPFSDFMKTAKRLTILTDSGSKDVRRAWMTGSRNGEHGLDASNKTGFLSIFA
ncbi:auxin response factor 18 [Senna tora]|uniref:Auxin response factor n=1 Tax=Senna tora TaxID=362788 RepID=A0A834SJS5_9FABA|nr:auxin response factor 18 [Senna tora]